MIFDYISDKDKELYEKHSGDTLRGRLAIVLNGDCIQGMIIWGELDKLYIGEVLDNLKCLMCLIIGELGLLTKLLEKFWRHKMGDS